jgi:hypothetical protein
MKLYGSDGKHIRRLKKMHLLPSEEPGYRFLMEAQELTRGLAQVCGPRILTGDSEIFELYRTKDFGTDLEIPLNYMKIHDFLSGTLKTLFGTELYYLLIHPDFHVGELKHRLISAFWLSGASYAKSLASFASHICNTINIKIFEIYKARNMNECKEIIARYIIK